MDDSGNHRSVPEVLVLWLREGGNPVPVDHCHGGLVDWSRAGIMVDVPRLAQIRQFGAALLIASGIAARQQNGLQHWLSGVHASIDHCDDAHATDPPRP